ncbi:metallophosphoesterase [Nocardioides daphniae]|uniref:Metallophosphoesterase n=1 Tax=Nocardioides daphniae TaxID=402297 RepID=A0A4P7UDN8_9ACTN|nr:metallophosphoesterase [Nocardioides daphniae]QCC78392.1 metallophosphoesterase [Nocardioides daphniae]GGD12851.1 metallophosphoesterase [Nocardioides daphniae]
MNALTALGRTAGLGLIAGSTLAAYAAWEARQYTLREVTVPLLPAGHEPLRVLHLSDIHMTPAQRAKQEWLASLADLDPDLVINTGDNLAHRHAVPHVVESLAGLLTHPGAYVMGSNDYFAPTMRNPFAYLLPDRGKRHTSTPHLPWPELKQAFDGGGWLDLGNGFGSLTVKGTRIAFAGVDDPHLGYDELDRVAGPADATSDVRLAVVHAPYLRVLDAFARDGYDAIIAGHTHGGQVCLPTVDGRGRALTTNCDLEPARAKGLHRHPAGSKPGEAGSSWLHVSAGVGTNPYVRFRVACRPEATLMTLVPKA